MNNKRITDRLSRLILTVWATLISCWAIAQDNGGGGGASVSVTTKSSSSDSWYANPWIWVVGAAVFILLLVALLRGGGSRRSD